MRGTSVSTDLLRVERLQKHYPLRGPGRAGRHARAVDDVSFSMAEGEILGLVGELGCGKTTLARLLVRLLEPTSGEIWFRDTPITTLSDTDLRAWRRNVQIVFQDHFASFDPRLPIGKSIEFPLRAHGLAKGVALRAEAQRLLVSVGLNPNLYSRLPHELSGGQRQRVAIARALAPGPALIIADEPVAALDLSAQAQILNLFAALRREARASCIFITHDLNVAAYLCDRVLVMYGGRVAEMASAETIFNNPRHPYTQALISAALPDRDKGTGRQIVLDGDPPRPSDPPPGCKFHPRCFASGPYCRHAEPVLKDVYAGHQVACHVAHGVAVA